MKISTDSKLLKKFRKSPWKYQRTFLTPLKDLDRFVSTAVNVHSPMESGEVVIEQIVFDPKNLMDLLQRHAVPDHLRSGMSIVAENEQETIQLLKSALSDWIDFLFIPTPHNFAIYADHDEYATFYGNTKGAVSRISEALCKEGCSQVKYERGL